MNRSHASRAFVAFSLLAACFLAGCAHPGPAIPQAASGGLHEALLSQGVAVEQAPLLSSSEPSVPIARTEPAPPATPSAEVVGAAVSPSIVTATPVEPEATASAEEVSTGIQADNVVDSPPVFSGIEKVQESTSVDQPAVVSDGATPKLPSPASPSTQSPSTKPAAPGATPDSVSSRSSSTVMAPPPTPAKKTPPPPPTPAVALPSPALRVPFWARGKEDVSYKVTFLGITMGFARFTFMGKAVVDGRDCYHLKVQAWTGSFLKFIYPVNDRIDYYIDVRTMAPVRQIYTRLDGSKRDEVMSYDQESGKITWRYKDNGEFRKTFDGKPPLYEPVTLAYCFRATDVSTPEKARYTYAGRKMYTIYARNVGSERLDTGAGTVDTMVVSPVISLDGKIENKGDIRMWVTADERRLPVRFYGKFRKIREWTLVGELVPNG